jgi:hypothetical protein
MRLNDARWIYAPAIFLSSALLFLLQPMAAKAILPWFGGSAGVWTACMLFFQVVLLLGYLYAYGITRHLNGRAQVVVHLGLLLLSLTMLPVNLANRRNFGADHPVPHILATLGASICLPYFVLSTTGPLLQAWYARKSHASFPYRLFALSNLASLAALVAYPLGVEPVLSLNRQFLAWSAAYLGFFLLTGLAALRGAPKQPRGGPYRLGSSVAQSFVWIALAACASTLWLAIANHLSQEVAAVPFLWILPLGLYLLSFILCFDREGWYRPRVYRWILPVAWLAMSFRLARQGLIGDLHGEILLFSAALFVCCMFCHGELARRKPEPKEGLSFFYLMVATGGALGAVFVGLVAPHVFSTYLELPLGIALCMILGVALLYGYSSPRQLARLIVVAMLAFVLGPLFRSTGTTTLLRVRNFYGTLQVIESGIAEMAARALYNGTILHGIEFSSPERSRIATTYYGPQSGAGLVLQSRHSSPQRIGVVGLGVGTLAAYGRAGDSFRFYEINPAVIRIASEHFRFLKESEARTEVVAGDGRLALEREPEHAFDVLALDAFSGDAIPVHLLTKEAFEIYFRHLRPGGIIAVHVTNKYLDLASVVQSIAVSIGKQSLLIHSDADRQHATYEAEWSLVAEDRGALRNFEALGHPLRAARPLRPWTDQYSNLFQILK